jgi:antitoxin HicB
MKNLKYFMALPYRIEIQPIPESKGGGYGASIPQLGKYAVCADGETIEEALNNLAEIKKERLIAYLEEGVVIPEPASAEEDYSGKFLVRIPKSLHRELAQRAKQNDISLNQLVTSLLSSGLVYEVHQSALQELKQEIKYLQCRIHDLRYIMQPSAPKYQISRYVFDYEKAA